MCFLVDPNLDCSRDQAKTMTAAPLEHLWLADLDPSFSVALGCNLLAILAGPTRLRLVHLVYQHHRPYRYPRCSVELSDYDLQS